MPKSCDTAPRASCPEKLNACIICPPPPPESNACVEEIDLNIQNINDDLRVERNGVAIVDDRRLAIGSYFRKLSGKKFGFRQGDIITLSVFAAGATFSIGVWFAAIKYCRNGQETVITVRDVNDSTPIPVTPGEEYFQFAQFTL